MGYPAHNELVLQIVEPIQVLQDEAELAHQLWILEILFEVRLKLGDKQGIVRRQRRDERRIDTEVRLGSMTGTAGSAIAIEGFVEENVLPFGDEIARGRGRCLACRERRQTACQGT